MTNTDTADAAATADQVAALADAGSQLVRVTVNNDEAAAALPEIVRRAADQGCDVPIIGDFHYNGHLLLAKHPECASALAKYRINPGNVGDKIRVALTARPNGDRTEEVLVAQQILQSLGLRSFAPQVTACPGCGRTTSTFFQHMAEDIQAYIREQMPLWRERHPGVEEMRVAVMGCVVNGPGESKHANIGISLPGTFEEPKAPVYVDGKLLTTLRGERIVG